jgi:hypothetical protein
MFVIVVSIYFHHRGVILANVDEFSSKPYHLNPIGMLYDEKKVGNVQPLPLSEMSRWDTSTSNQSPTKKGGNINKRYEMR